MTDRSRLFLPGRLLGPAGLLLAAAWVLAAVPGVAQQGAAPPRTTKQGVFTKAQADSGKAVFDKYCASCHGFKPSEKSAANPDLAGEPFLANWDGKSVKELQTVIRTTMPNDGSAELTEVETVDVVAFILQQNGFAPGSTPLPAGDAAIAITIVK